MKIIKSFLLITLGLSATNLLQAQEVKTMTAPPAAAPKILKADDRPSPKPVFTPQPEVAATAAPAPAGTVAPSPFKKDEAATTTDKLKSAAVIPVAAPVTDVQPAIKPTVMQPSFLRQQQ